MFREFDDKMVDSILSPTEGEPDPAITRRSDAYRMWVEGQYGAIFEHSDSSGPRIPRDAARDFMACLRAGDVPAWAVPLAPLAQIRAAAKGGE